MSARPAAARAEGAVRPRLRLVRRRGRGLIARSASTRLAPVVVLAAIVVAAVVFAILLEQVVLSQSAFKLARLQRRLNAAQARHQDLLHAAATLESPARIERLARARLGMVEPSRVEYVVADVASRRGRRLAATPFSVLDGAGLAAPGEPDE